MFVRLKKRYFVILTNAKVIKQDIQFEKHMYVELRKSHQNVIRKR